MIRRSADARAAARTCAEETAGLLAGMGQAAIALSGGSTPRLMFQALAELRVDWRRVHLFWVDERAVPPDDPQSNYRMTEEHLLRPAKIPAANVHRILAELEPQEAARRYEAEIREYFRGDEPRFDLVHAGMGADGHTASLFPGSPQIEDRAGLSAAVYVEKMSQWRITLLPQVLLGAQHCFLLAVGDEKREMLRDVMEGPLDPLRRPAQLLVRQRETVCFIDDAADYRIGG